MMKVLDQVRATLLREQMLEPGERVIVAVSGGPDSVTLLHVLHRLAPEFGVSLHVFHLDHGLRGAESAADAAYVAELARRWGLEATIVTLRPGELKAEAGSLQANARRRRYGEIRALAERIGASKVATGHNRDDQAETVLMRLLRGAGTKGLAGIPAVRRERGLTLIRPLLAVTRAEIEQYCSEYKLSPRLDASNLQTDYLRNRVRLELLPLLAREYNPAIGQRLAELAAILRDEDQWMEEQAAAALARCRLPEADGRAEGPVVILDGARLTAEPVALARRVVRLAARELLGPGADPGLAAVGRVLEAAGRRDGTHLVELPGGLVVRVEYGRCRFELADDRAPDADAGGPWPVAPSGETEVPELGLRVRTDWVSGPQAGPGDSNELFLDADLLPGPLAIRFRRPGDRIWPTGMTGSKKLQDILVDAKVPRALRSRIPLLVAGDDVIWVIGHRKDRRCLAGPHSTRIIRVRVDEV